MIYIIYDIYIIYQHNDDDCGDDDQRTLDNRPPPAPPRHSPGLVLRRKILERRDFQIQSYYL